MKDGMLINEDLGKLILRISTGGLMLFHGWDKIIHGIDFIQESLFLYGLPDSIAYGVYIGEIIVPIMLVLGINTRIASLIFSFNMLVSIMLIYHDQLLTLTPHGGWSIELNLLFFFNAIILFFTGPGKYIVRFRKWTNEFIEQFV